MTAALFRLVALAAAAIAIAAVAGGLHVGDGTVKLRSDALIVARELEILNGTCPVGTGPLKPSECARQVGQYYVAFLPPKYTVRLREGWVIGLYDRIG